MMSSRQQGITEMLKQEKTNSWTSVPVAFIAGNLTFSLHTFVRLIRRTSRTMVRWTKDDVFQPHMPSL